MLTLLNGFIHLLLNNSLEVFVVVGDVEDPEDHRLLLVLQISNDRLDVRHLIGGQQVELLLHEQRPFGELEKEDQRL